MKFSETLKRLRGEKNMTQQELADKLYISRSAVAKWEQGRGYPSLEMLEKLSEIFNISIDDLLSEREYRFMAIDSNQKVKKHSRYYIVATIVGGIFVIMFAIIFGLYFKLKKEAESIFYHYALYGTVEVREEGLEFICVDDYSELCFENKKTFTVANNEAEKIAVYNQYGEPTDINSIRTGYQVKISFTSEKENEIENMNLYRVDVIDDYVEGDYYVYGFFLSTEAVNYEQAPIYNGNEETLDLRGEEESLAMRYPYSKVYRDSTVYSDDRILRAKDIEELAYSQEYGNYCILKKLTYRISVSKRVKKVYVYALDNTDRGYSRVGEINTPDVYGLGYVDGFQIENGGLFYRNKEGENKDVRFPEKIEAIFHIEIEFYEDISNVTISEYNKNQECIYQTQFIRGENFNTNYITQDTTRYVTVESYTQTGEKTQVHYSWATRGDEIEIPLETYYGFVIKRTLKLY